MSNQKKNKIYGLIFIILLFLADQVLHLSYDLKVLLKVVLVLCSFVCLTKKDFKYYTLRNFKRSKYKYGLFLSILAFIGIFITYFIVSEYMDLSQIKHDFIHKYQLTGIRFFIASFYLIFINAFLEEYFFRGFLFLNTDQSFYSSLYSACLFSFYHLANFIQWFKRPILLLIPLIGLIIVGLIFNELCKKSQDVFHSYIPHLFADLAIVIIGYTILF